MIYCVHAYKKIYADFSAFFTILTYVLLTCRRASGVGGLHIRKDADNPVTHQYYETVVSA